MTRYGDSLRAGWDLHNKPKSATAPTVISTFAGCGGSSLGYSMAGYRELLAVEWDDNAVATFRENFHDVSVFHGDVASLSVDRILEITKIEPRQLDIFDGSPPCQGFSTIGARVIDDPRNSLFKEYVRIIKGLQPKVFVMENVSGMVKGKMKLVFSEILTELKSCGYKVSARLMNSMYFNVPQERERLIFIGVREDLEVEASHPRPASFPIPANIVIDDLVKIREGWGVQDPRKLQQSNPNDYAKKWRSAQRPCCTIVRSRPPIALFQNGVHRSFTSEECAKLTSFPSEFKFVGTETQKIARIGNSVPPFFMKAIAEHIESVVLRKAKID